MNETTAVAITPRNTSKAEPGKWRLITRCSGIGHGFNNYTGFVVDDNGKEVASFVDHATQITMYGNGFTREKCRRWDVIFEEGESYPHSANAHLIVAAPDLLMALEAAMRGDKGWGEKAQAAIAKARGVSA